MLKDFISDRKETLSTYELTQIKNTVRITKYYDDIEYCQSKVILQ